MNPPPITITIDVKKLNKDHFIVGKPDRDGKPVLYCDLVLFPSKEERYGNTHFVVQGVPKQARENGVKGGIVGNAKVPTPEPPQRQRQPLHQKPGQPSRYSQQNSRTDDSGDGEVDF